MRSRLLFLSACARTSGYRYRWWPHSGRVASRPQRAISSRTAHPTTTTTTTTKLPHFTASRLHLHMSTAAGQPEGGMLALLERRIREALEPDSVQVLPVFDDDPNGSHVRIRVIGACFEGKRPVARHQMVYKAIWKEMETGMVHAVDSLEALTPSEAS